MHTRQVNTVNYAEQDRTEHIEYTVLYYTKTLTPQIREGSDPKNTIAMWKRTTTMIHSSNDSLWEQK